MAALCVRDPKGFVAALKRLFAHIPYDLTVRQNEQMWQTIVYVALTLIGCAFSKAKRTIVATKVEEVA